MPRLVRTTPRGATEKIIAASHYDLMLALTRIAISALDDSESGVDTAAVVYAELDRLGITVP